MTDAERIPHFVNLAWRFRAWAKREPDRKEHFLWHARWCVRLAKDARDRLGREKEREAA